VPGRVHSIDLSNRNQAQKAKQPAISANAIMESKIGVGIAVIRASDFLWDQRFIKIRELLGGFFGFLLTRPHISIDAVHC